MFRNRNDFLVGRQFGPYRIEATLGKGTVAIAYLALNSDDEEVALKVLTPLAQANPDIRASFDREFVLMSRLDHPNIVHVRRTGTIADVGYIEMDLVSGPTVLEHIKTAPQPAADVARFGVKMALALHHVHERQIVHRDVKPANVLLSDSEPMLFDFGLALDLEAPDALAGRIYGSPLYLSPEQALAGPPVDGRADLYGLGASMYHMIAGQPPFWGERMELLRSHVEADPPLLPAHNDGARAVIDVISRAMAKNPDERPQSGQEMADLLESTDATSLTSSSDSTKAGSKRSKRSWFNR